MFVKRGAIGKEARDYLHSHIEGHFKYEEGNDLRAVIREVLRDRDIFTFLALHSERGQGLRLGNVSYWDDTRVYIHYGLTLNFDELPRHTALYNFESWYDNDKIGEQMDLRLGWGISLGEGAEPPSPEDFVAQVNFALANPKSYLIKLNLKPEP